MHRVTRLDGDDELVSECLSAVAVVDRAAAPRWAYAVAWGCAANGDLLLAVGGADNLVRVVRRDAEWRSGTAAEEAVLPCGGLVSGADFSADSTRLAASCHDRAIRVWGRDDAAGWTLLCEQKQHAPCLCVRFAPPGADTDGSAWVAGGGEAGTLVFYRAAAATASSTVTAFSRERTVAVGAPVTAVCFAAAVPPLCACATKDGRVVVLSLFRRSSAAAATSRSDGVTSVWMKVRSLVVSPSELRDVSFVGSGHVAVAAYTEQGTSSAPATYTEQGCTQH